MGANTAMTSAKAELRGVMRERRQALPPAEATRSAVRAAEHLLALPELAGVKTVAIYAAVRGELGTATLDRGLRGRGVAVAYPICPVDKSARVLAFALAAPTDLVPGTWDLAEPSEGAPRVALDALDAFVLPGLAFDRTGARLGWGGAYYDHTLAAAPRSLRIGFAHAFQVVPRVPETNGDERVDVIVTELGARRTGHRQPPPVE